VTSGVVYFSYQAHCCKIDVLIVSLTIPLCGGCLHVVREGNDPMAVTSVNRVFFAFDGDGARSRLRMDVNDRRLVGEVKERVRRVMKLDTDEVEVSSTSKRRKILSLSYAGAVLDDSWRFADLGIPFGAQVARCYKIITSEASISVRPTARASIPPIAMTQSPPVLSPTPPLPFCPSPFNGGRGVISGKILELKMLVGEF